MSYSITHTIGLVNTHFLTIKSNRNFYPLKHFRWLNFILEENTSNENEFLFFFQSLQSNRSVKDFCCCCVFFSCFINVHWKIKPPNHPLLSIHLLCDAFYLFSRKENGFWIISFLFFFIFGFFFGDIVCMLMFHIYNKSLIVTAMEL